MTEPRCQEVEPRLLDMMEGELDADERTRIEAHLRGCASCREERRQLESLREALQNDTPPDPGAAFWQQFPDRVWRAYREEAPAVSTAAVPSPLQRAAMLLRDLLAGPHWVQVAAALLIAIGAGYFLTQAPLTEIDAARYQAQIRSSETLSTLARRASADFPPPAQFGFSAGGDAGGFFLLGYWYAEALAYAAGEDADAAEERRRAIAAAIGGVAPQLADELRDAAALGELAALEPKLVRVAAAEGERPQALFRAGVWLANLALAASARDRTALGLAAAPLAHVEHDLERVEIAPGARRDIHALTELLARGELSEPDIDTVRRLVRRVQTVLL